ncbi:MAG: DUF1302 family protein [candidate division WOR-3 bacterium]
MAVWAFIFSLVSAGQVPVQGELSSRALFRIKDRDSSCFSFFTTAGSLVFTPLANERLETKLGFTIRAQGFPLVNSATQLSEADIVEPVSVLLDEAYVRFYDLVPGLTFTAGRQRVHWGSADVINPTDNFTTPDYSDPLVWDRRRPVWMLHLGYSPLNALGMEFGLKPVFEPALNPPGSWYDARILPTAQELRSALVAQLIGMGYDPVLAEQIAGQFDIRIREQMNLPDQTLKDLTWGGRVRTHLGRFDFSLSGLRGYDFLPEAKPVLTTDFAQQRLDFVLNEFFPQKTVFGADLATELAGIGLWAEAAYAFYDDTLLSDRLSVISGIDYSFAGFYLNLQYLHGDFPLARLQTEPGRDFLLAGLEHRFISDRLLVRLGGVLDLKKRSFGLIPLVRVTPVSGLNLELTGLVFSGKTGSAFAPLDRVRELGFGISYQF